MQGWRKRLEDAHVAAIQLGEKKNIDIFGVYMVIVEKKLFNSSQTILLMNQLKIKIQKTISLKF